MDSKSYKIALENIEPDIYLESRMYYKIKRPYMTTFCFKMIISLSLTFIII